MKIVRRARSRKSSSRRPRAPAKDGVRLRQRERATEIGGKLQQQSCTGDHVVQDQAGADHGHRTPPARAGARAVPRGDPTLPGIRHGGAAAPVRLGGVTPRARICSTTASRRSMVSRSHEHALARLDSITADLSIRRAKATCTSAAETEAFGASTRGTAKPNSWQRFESPG